MNDLNLSDLESEEPAGPGGLKLPNGAAPARVRALEGDWPLWDTLDSPTKNFTALAASLINLSGLAATGPIRRQNLERLGFLVNAGASIAWNAPLFIGVEPSVASIQSLSPNPSLLAGLAQAIELVPPSRASPAKKTPRGKNAVFPPFSEFPILASVWKHQMGAQGWSWLPSDVSRPVQAVVSAVPPVPDEKPLWEAVAANGWWKWLRLTPSGFMTDRFDHPVLLKGCLDDTWWTAFCSSAVHRPDWSAGKESLVRCRARHFWRGARNEGLLTWLQISKNGSSSDPLSRSARGKSLSSSASDPFFWDRDTALLVLADLLQDKPEPVESLALSMTSGAASRLSHYGVVALAYAGSSTRSTMASVGQSKVPVTDLLKAINQPAPAGRGWALWDVLTPSDVEEIFIQPNRHGLFSLVAKECRAVDAHGGASRVQNQTGVEAWKIWAQGWPMDRTPTEWITAELDVLAAQSQKAFRSPGAQFDFVHQNLARSALAAELRARLFRLLPLGRAPLLQGLSPPTPPVQLGSQDIFWAALDALALPAAPGDVLGPRLIREGDIRGDLWSQAAGAAGGWPFESPAALDRLLRYGEPKFPEVSIKGIEGPASRRGVLHRDNRAFRIFTASMAISPLSQLVPHLAGLPQMVERFVSGWSYRARKDLAYVLFLRASRLPLDDPSRPHMAQAAWAVVCLSSIPNVVDGKEKLSPQAAEQASQLFLKYGRAPAKDVPDRQSFLGPFSNPSALQPLLRSAAESLLSEASMSAQKKKIPRVALERVLLSLAAAATDADHPIRPTHSRRL